MCKMPRFREAVWTGLFLLAACELPQMRESSTSHGGSWKKETVGSSVGGEPIAAWILPGASPGTLIIGGIHGDEPSSVELVMALRDHLLRRPEARAGRRVILVPRANPDGLRRDTRGNSRGVDVNRNFPARNFRENSAGGPHPLSEPETRALAQTIRKHGPVCILSVHAPLSCVDPDGGASTVALARQMSALGGLPLRNLPEHPGSLGSYVSQELGLVMITYELKHRYRLEPGSLYGHIQALTFAIRAGE